MINNDTIDKIKGYMDSLSSEERERLNQIDSYDNMSPEDIQEIKDQIIRMGNPFNW